MFDRALNVCLNVSLFQEKDVTCNEESLNQMPQVHMYDCP